MDVLSGCLPDLYVWKEKGYTGERADKPILKIQLP
jgi:hypothetical protein